MPFRACLPGSVPAFPRNRHRKGPPAPPFVAQVAFVPLVPRALFLSQSPNPTIPQSQAVLFTTPPPSGLHRGHRFRARASMEGISVCFPTSSSSRLIRRESNYSNVPLTTLALGIERLNQAGSDNFLVFNRVSIRIADKKKKNRAWE